MPLGSRPDQFPSARNVYFGRLSVAVRSISISELANNWLTENFAIRYRVQTKFQSRFTGDLDCGITLRRSTFSPYEFQQVSRPHWPQTAVGLLADVPWPNP